MMRHLFFLILVLNTVLLADRQKELQNPWEYFSAISKGDYLSPIIALKKQEAAYIASELKDSYYQAIGTFLSFIGKYDEAQEYFDHITSSGNQLPIQQKFSDLKRQDAIPRILSAIKGKQVIMINEAHHVPETRVLTYALLKPLYDRGFRYLAAETFDANGVSKSKVKGFPLRSIGFYTASPIFGDIAREALDIGYELIAYEHTDFCDYKADPKGCQDKRERGQAQNLVDRVLKRDPKAKILVHAGYGHIDKIGVTNTFPWIPMAKYFRDLSGIDPFSIDQVEFRSRGKKLAESQNYRRIVEYFKITQPSVLTSKKGLWTALPGHFDVQIILPDSPHDNSFPFWARAMLERRAIDPIWERCPAFPCVVQAVLVKEDKDDYIPSDQVYAWSKKDTSNKLNLRPGKYFINYISSIGNAKESLSVQ